MQRARMCVTRALQVVQEMVDHLLKGDDKALTELSYDSRKQFITKYGLPDTKRVATVCYASKARLLPRATRSR